MRARASTEFLSTCVIGLLLAIVAAGCGMSRPDPTSSAKESAYESKARSSHVVVIVMENKEYGDVIGSSSAPYVNRLARRYGLATNSYGVSHPSLPNYLRRHLRHLI